MRVTTRRRGDERGSVTAEFAASLPAVVLVLAVCLGALQVGAVQIRLQDAAADAARTIARGDAAELAASRAEGAVPGATLTTSDEGDAVCATITRTIPVAGMFAVPITATSCALAGGR